MHQRFIFYTIGFEGESLKEAPFLFDFDLKKKKKNAGTAVFHNLKPLLSLFLLLQGEPHAALVVR